MNPTPPRSDRIGSRPATPRSSSFGLRSDPVAYLRTRPCAMGRSYGWRFAFLALDADLRGVDVAQADWDMTFEMINQDGEGSEILCDPWSSPEALASVVCRRP